MAPPVPEGAPDACPDDAGPDTPTFEPGPAFWPIGTGALRRLPTPCRRPVNSNPEAPEALAAVSEVTGLDRAVLAALLEADSSDDEGFTLHTTSDLVGGPRRRRAGSDAPAFQAYPGPDVFAETIVGWGGVPTPLPLGLAGRYARRLRDAEEQQWAAERRAQALEARAEGRTPGRRAHTLAVTVACGVAIVLHLLVGHQGSSAWGPSGVRLESALAVLSPLVGMPQRTAASALSVGECVEALARSEEDAAELEGLLRRDTSGYSQMLMSMDDWVVSVVAKAPPGQPEVHRCLRTTRGQYRAAVRSLDSSVALENARGERLRAARRDSRGARLSPSGA